jgi:hypothetical protein
MNDLDPLWEENSGYQWIAKRARLECAQEIFLELGTARFGPSDKETGDRIERITDLKVLREIVTRILTADSWSEALGPV